MSQVALQFKALADQGKLDEAERFLSEFDPKNRAESRMKEHFLGQLLMYRGDFASARDRFENVRRIHGDHLRLTSDRVSCHFLLGDILLWKTSTEELRSRFESLQDKVCDETYYRTGLLLAKMDEELGHLSRALATYSEMRRRFDETKDPIRHLNCLIQEVRIQSMMGMIRGLGSAYERLLTFSEREANAWLYLESQHALILAECHLISPTTAFHRFKKILSRSDLRESDRRLFYFDLLDAMMISRASKSELKMMIDLGIAAESAQEQNIARLASACENRDPTRYSEELTPAGHLRILSLHARLFASDRTEASRRRFYLLLDGLDRDSRALWNSRVGSSIEAAETIELQLHLGDRLVEYNGKTISLQKRKALWDLLVAVQKNPHAGLDELTQAIWQSPYNDSYFHRIRMTAKRLNAELLEICAIPDAVSVSTTGVELSSRIRISR